MKKNNFDKKKNNNKSNNKESAPVPHNGDRFASVFSDPKFSRIPKKVEKVELKDERFKSMFTDKKFNYSTVTDERGFKTKKNIKENHELRKYYKMDDEKREEDDQDFEEEEIQDAEHISEGHEEEEMISEGEDKEIGDSDSDTSQEFAEFLDKHEQEQMNEEDVWEGEEEDIKDGDASKRLSVLNLDWDNISANDLYVLFSSFCKSGESRIEKVEIYPSQFGVEQMEIEKTQGPDASIFSNKKKNEKVKIVKGLDDVIQEEKEEDYNGFDNVALRKYEMKKIRYYYAVVYCDSVETASSIYTECDGMEVERTQSFLDLRFIPDSLTEFPYPPKQVCKETPPDYDPQFQMNRALNHSKVKLTWDTNDNKREETLNKAFKKGQFNEEEVAALIMSSDSEEDLDAKAFAESFQKNLKEKNNSEIGLLKKKRNNEVEIQEGKDIEITFNTGFESLSDKLLNKNQDKEASKYDKFKEKKKEKKSEKKAEEQEKREKKKKMRNKRQTSDDEDEEDKSESESESEEESEGVKASKAELELLINDNTKDKDFDFDPTDNRFKAIYKDKNFALDPTDSNFKKNVKVLEEMKKSKRKKNKF